MSQCLDTTVIQTPSDSSTSLADSSKPGVKDGSKAFIIYSPLFRFFFYWVAFVILALVPLLSSAPFMGVHPLNIQAPIASINDALVMDVQLIMEAVSVDPILRTMTMSWYPYFRALNCSSPTVMDVFMSNALLDVTSPSWTSQGFDQLVFRLNSTEECAAFTPYASFRTVTKLVGFNQRTIPSRAVSTSLQSYPFDKYLAPFLFYTRALGSDHARALEVTDSFGVAVNFDISLSFARVNIDSVGSQESLAMVFQVERSKATKIFVVLVAVTNWLIAMAFVTICSAAMVYKSTEIYSEIFVVPVGALFAFTSVRANLPGAPPGFGATIDMFTILPVLVIMSLCSFALLLMILLRRISRHQAILGVD